MSNKGNEGRYEPARTSDGKVDQDAVATASPLDPAERQPKSDHNRRLALFLDPAVFAAEAGVTEGELREYEATSPDGKFDLEVARRVGEALDRLEAVTPTTERIIS